jgi:hypothetical protein
LGIQGRDFQFFNQNLGDDSGCGFYKASADPVEFSKAKKLKP